MKGDRAMRMYIPEGDNNTYVTFVSTMPHKTRILLVSFMENSKPDNLLADLEAYGWSEDNNVGLRPLITFPSLTNPGRVELDLHAAGSGRLGAWSDSEATKNLRNARKVLKHYGFNGVPHRKLTIADMM